MPESFRFVPPSASSMSPEVDALMLFLIGVSGFFILLIMVLIAYFAIRYRRRPGPPPALVHEDRRLEAAWITIPLILVMVMFGWGARVYTRLFTPPPDAMEIYVVGKQWMWKVQHPTGAREINALHVPIGRPVKLLLSSQDVIHSFYVPAFRIKHDALPGRSTAVWFQATKPGVYHLFCAEYCGNQHSGMIGKVYAMEPSDYEAWLAGVTPNVSPVESGRRLFQQFACVACHGERAPSLAGLFGSTVQLADGSTVTADENYLRQSILDSTSQIVRGYAPIMPSFRGQLTEEQLNDLVQYIKSLQDPQQQQQSTVKPAPNTY